MTSILSFFAKVLGLNGDARDPGALLLLEH
jgi:hypothetical protein